ncbi:MAG: uroporphyrinogen-III synthase [Bacteroidales bacterium]|nr:uroporphyrinogen-III synthase [Bacteroidales bacterium]
MNNASKEIEKLLNKRVFISTRPEGKSTEMKQLLESENAKLIEFPMIEIEPKKLTTDELTVLNSHRLFDYIIFTSVNAVDYYFKALEVKDVKSKLIAIGESTALAIEKNGYKVDYVGKGITRKALAEELNKFTGPEKNTILWPTGNLSPNNFKNSLSSRFVIKRLDIYRTVIPNQINVNALNDIKNDNYDVVFFYSRSAIINFVKVWSENIDSSDYSESIKKIRCAALGSSTFESLKELSFNPLYHSTKHNTESLFEATLQYFKNEIVN